MARGNKRGIKREGREGKGVKRKGDSEGENRRCFLFDQSFSFHLSSELL